VATAIRRHGVPQRLLSDNGLAFNPTRRGFTGKLVDYLLGLGVKPITGKPDRPTTQGKIERFQCATRRSATFPVQPGGTRREVPGPDG